VAEKVFPVKIEYLAAYPEFIAELAELHFSEWGYLNPGGTLEGKKEYLGRNCGRGGVPSFIIAVEDAELIGSASLIAQDMDDRPDLTPWLADVFVKPGYRGRGVATALIQRIEAEARSAGITTLYLYTPGAAGLYRRLGWNTVEERKYKGVDVIIMAKTPG
jgi:GNAT superfamily N-acetyltransferase